MSRPVWFWQRIVSPHMAGLASALAGRGVEVTYAAERPMSADRAAQGWGTPDPGGARLVYAQDAAAAGRLARSAPADSLHICQGLRGNGVVATAQAVLAQRGLTQWVVMETVENTGWRGLVRRLEYRRLIASRRKAVSGYLATGHETADWLVARGARADRVFPFAYFLADEIGRGPAPSRPPGGFRILFVGQFIELKRLDLLIRAVAALGREDVELQVIGSGPQEEMLRRLAAEALGSRHRWIGRVPSGDVPGRMAQADLLVLPSRYDGWGAVVSEAIMVGTPAVCSDRCGSAGVVRASGRGGVFPADDLGALTALLRRLVDEGPPSTQQRAALAQWGRRLGAGAGADYLKAILAFADAGGDRPAPPWMIPAGKCQ
ncbi:glycosyltransferase [Brevundimonas sp. UBA5936]|uniref:glycosyltransferase n=1 Tax=Brevundimonas sp. UBA5936 TaxID=1946133 RepID=UPI0025B81FB6|nr:glycosyltransferase [Brevundimonas sp. UBA5936]